MIGRFALIVAAAAFTMMPAEAQRRVEAKTGSHIGAPKAARVPENVSTDAGQNARIVMADFARCTLDRDRKGVESALKLPLDAPWQSAIAKLVTRGVDAGDCLGSGGMKFKPALLRGALFVELWRRGVREQAGVRTAAAVATTPIDLQLTSATLDETAKQQYALLIFADCVVSAGKQAASDLITAPTASVQQTAAYAAVQPLLGPCLPEGNTIKLSKSILEGSLAEVLVRTVAAPPPAKAQ